MSQVVPGRNRDEDSGRYQEEYSPEEVIEAVKKQDDICGTGDVAAEIGSSTETAYYKLRAMEEQGYVESQKVGQARVWRVVEEDIEEE